MTWLLVFHAQPVIDGCVPNRFNPRGDRSAAAGHASEEDTARPAWSVFQIMSAMCGALNEIDEERRHFPGPQDCSATRRLTLRAGVDQHLAVV
jgi:hypothetical protein